MSIVRYDFYDEIEKETGSDIISCAVSGRPVNEDGIQYFLMGTLATVRRPEEWLNLAKNDTIFKGMPECLYLLPTESLTVDGIKVSLEEWYLKVYNHEKLQYHTLDEFKDRVLRDTVPYLIMSNLDIPMEKRLAKLKVLAVNVQVVYRYVAVADKDNPKYDPQQLNQIMDQERNAKGTIQ